MSAEEIAQALFRADEADVKAVWATLGVSSHLKHRDLHDALWTLWLMRWKAKALGVLGSVKARLEPYTAHEKQFPTAWMAAGVGGTLLDIEQSGLLGDSPKLDPEPMPNLDGKDPGELVWIIEQLQALIAVKDEALKKQNIAFDPPVQAKAVQRALAASPEDAKGIYHRQEALIDDLRNESWAYQTAFHNLSREHRVLMDALHERLNDARDTIVDLWHEGKIEGELRDALGLSEVEYGLWLKDPRSV